MLKLKVPCLTVWYGYLGSVLTQMGTAGRNKHL